MTRKRRVGFRLILIVAAPLWGKQGLAQDELAEAAADGLELIDSRFSALYWRPGSALAKYGRIVLLDPFVQLRDGWLIDQNRGKLSANSLTDDDVRRVTAALANQFKDVFPAVFEEDGSYEIVNVAAADVLVLRPAILSVDIGADVFGAAAAISETSTLSMTLYLEFFDSVTNTRIGRAFDHVTDPDSDRSAVRRVIRRWGNTTLATISEGVNAGSLGTVTLTPLELESL
jgi:hypothetical protein